MLRSCMGTTASPPAFKMNTYFIHFKYLPTFWVIFAIGIWTHPQIKKIGIVNQTREDKNNTSDIKNNTSDIKYHKKLQLIWSLICKSASTQKIQKSDIKRELWNSWVARIWYKLYLSERCAAHLIAKDTALIFKPW